ncbi:MAG TPA: amidase [Vicinamibacteria bacterium]|nr:amidase [Vicinamibacteria bacterium]
MSRELLLRPLHELASLLRTRQISCEEVVRACIDRTEALEATLNTYITFLPERALEQARRRDREPPRGPLHGIPLSLKDVFDTGGIPTTAGARFLSGRTPEQDAEVTRRLDEAGCVLLGKANLNKFAGGESGTNPDFGDMKNPWNQSYSPSGSSGGSAAQVAVGMVSLSMGSDNGGSIRNPASVCGIVGFKPTHGLVSTEGMFPRAYSVDHAGPLTRTVKDAAIALEILADVQVELEGDVRGARVGVDRNLVRLGERDVLRVFEDVLKELEGVGFELVDVELPTPEEITPIMYTIFFCEWATAHDRWMREKPEEYQGGSRAALLIPAVDYLKAQQVRRTLQQRTARAMQPVDLLVSPCYPIVRRSHRALPVVGGRRLTLDDALRYTMPYDLLGLPAISLPGGFADDDAPVGFQIAGKPFSDALVLRAAHVYEQATHWHDRHPPI